MHYGLVHILMKQKDLSMLKIQAMLKLDDDKESAMSL